MEELRLAGVGVMENQYLMPLKQTRNALADAQNKDMINVKKNLFIAFKFNTSQR